MSGGPGSITVPAPAPAGPDAPKPAGEEPKLLAGKYKSAEDLERGYKELEAKLGQPKAEPKADAPKADAPADLTIQKPAEVTPPAGVNMAEAEAEFAKNGKLSDETYKKFAGKGFDRGTVDAFIEGQKALAAQKVAQVAGRVGGEDNLKALLKYAQENYSEAEMQAYNAAVTSKDMSTVLMAVDALKARYTATNGSDPKLIGGEGGKGGNTDVFKSMTEITTAMSDPRYKNDAAYREAVIAKIARTDYGKLAR